MKFILIAISIFLFSASAKAQDLKFNGYYYSFADARNDSSWHYLRFYPGGSVIEVNSVARPGKKMAKFEKNSSPNLFQGTFTVTGNDIQFSLSDQQKQKIAYKGTIDGNKIKLHSHSFVTGSESDEVYEYVRIRNLDQ